MQVEISKPEKNTQKILNQMRVKGNEMNGTRINECAMIKKMTYNPLVFFIYNENHYCDNCQNKVDKSDKYCRFCGSKFTEKKTEYDINPKELLRKLLAKKYNEEKAEIIIKNIEKISVSIDEKKGISKIEIGDTIKCIDCGKAITLDGNTLIFDEEAEYIYCPNCGAKKDVQIYHINGEKL